MIVALESRQTAWTSSWTAYLRVCASLGQAVTTWPLAKGTKAAESGLTVFLMSPSAPRHLQPLMYGWCAALITGYARNHGLRHQTDIQFADLPCCRSDTTFEDPLIEQK